MTLKSVLKKKRQQAELAEVRKRQQENVPSNLSEERVKSNGQLKPKYQVGDEVHLRFMNAKTWVEGKGTIESVHNRLNGGIGYRVTIGYANRKIAESDITEVIKQAREEMRKGETNSQPIVNQPQQITTSSEKTRRVKVLYQHDTGLIYVIRISQNIKPLEEDYLVRLQGNRIATVEKMEMHSSTIYTVFFGNNRLCGCKGFQMSGDERTCRHIEALVKLVGEKV